MPLVSLCAFAPALSILVRIDPLDRPLLHLLRAHRRGLRGGGDLYELAFGEDSSVTPLVYGAGGGELSSHTFLDELQVSRVFGRRFVIGGASGAAPTAL